MGIVILQDMRRRRKRKPAQMSLSGRGAHGGLRAGAGRPKGRSNHYVPHITRPKVTRHKAVHVTMKRVAGLPSMRRPRAYEVIRQIFVKEKARKGFRLVHYAVRGNHMHLVCEGDTTMALSRGIQRVASTIARKLNKLFRRRGRFFADRFHGRVLTAPRDVRNVLRYVLLNEHKDKAERDIVVEGFDPYSSSLYFDGWRGRGEMAVPTRASPVARARSFLLQKAWRRAGLVDAGWRG